MGSKNNSMTTNETIDALLAILEEQEQTGLKDFIQKAADGNRIHGTTSKKKEDGISVTGYNVPWIHLNTTTDGTTYGVTANGLTELLSVIADVDSDPGTDDPPDTPPGQAKKAFKSTAPFGPPVTLTAEEVAALPGAVEFMQALMTKIVEKAIEFQTPPPAQPAGPEDAPPPPATP